MRRKRHLSAPLVLVIALAMALAVPASASPGDRLQPANPPAWELAAPDDLEVADDLWFVEFTSAPAIRGGNAATRGNERAALRRAAAQLDGEVEVERDFQRLWNGVTVRGSLQDVAELQGTAGIRAVMPVAVIEQPEPEGISPALANAITMTGADIAQSELGFSGEGVSVAIIDTGIDYNHPDLGGTGDQDNRIPADPSSREMDHPRVTHGWDYVGDEFNPADPDAPVDPAPNPDPIDFQGHGTHVAGIVGASAASDDGVTGVAPGVTFGAYKVFGPGSTTADIIVEALEDAYEDGMDVVNMSLGASLAWGQDYPTSRASNELAHAGVVVVNSAGNDGTLGAYTLSAPANAHDIISVASADNTFFEAFVFEVEQLDDVLPFSSMQGAEMPPTEGTSEPLWAPPVTTVDGVTGRLGCAAADFAGMPDGAVAHVERGFCPFADKYLNAANAGASGVIIYNNVAGQFAGTIADAGIDGVWSVSMGRDEGLALQGLLDAGETVVLEFSDETATLPNPTGGLASSFTSWGMDPELGFNPSVMAPGGLINSTYPLPSGGYAVLSGTSMAAPHVAGAAALLLEAEPDLDPFDVRDRLQNTAEPAPWSLNPGLLESSFRQGAGMIRVDRSITATQTVTPGQVAMGHEDVVTTTMTLTNASDTEVTYTVVNRPAIEIAVNTFAPDFFLYGAGVDVDGTTVTVPAGGSTEVTATITAPVIDGLPNHQYGGFITFTAEGATDLVVPYAGFAGDYVEELPLFGHWFWGPGADDEIEWIDLPPVLAGLDADGDLVVVPEGHTYRLDAGDLPTVAAFFGHFPREMRMVVTEQRTGREHLVLQEEYLRRSSASGARYLFTWDGRLPAGNSGNTRPPLSGDYTVEVQVLRTLGDADNPDHWDTWESSFTIDTRRGGPIERPGRGNGRG